jgi:hypothetical protein
MRLLRVLGIVALCLLGVTLIANASSNSFGISEVGHVTFSDPVRVGTTLLHAGDYEVRHVMQGEDHLMVFKRANTNEPGVTVRCKLVSLGRKAEKTAAVYEMNAANEKVLVELVFGGDTAKHVF